MNKEDKGQDNFTIFIVFVTPLIMNHPEPCFDDLLANWMNVKAQCSKWKTNEGRNQSQEEQIDRLLRMWQSNTGESANVRTFIGLLEGKPYTKWICDQLQKQFTTCTRDKISPIMKPAISTISSLETPFQEEALDCRRLNLEESKIESNTWNCDVGAVLSPPSTSSTIFVQIGKKFSGNRDSSESLVHHRFREEQARMNDYVKDPTTPRIIRKDAEGNSLTKVPGRVKAYSILLMGDNNVGKTTLLQNLGASLDKTRTSTDYCNEYSASICVGSETIIVSYYELKDATKNLGQRVVKQIFRNLIKKVDGVILLYEITNKKTFSSVKKWSKDVNSADNQPSLLILGNKLDLIENDPKNRKVLTQKLIKLAKTNSAHFSEISSTNKVSLGRTMVIFGGVLINRYSMLLNSATQCNSEQCITGCCVL